MEEDIKEIKKELAELKSMVSKLLDVKTTVTIDSKKIINTIKNSTSCDK